jgi:hypothetical protein
VDPAAQLQSLCSPASTLLFSNSLRIENPREVTKTLTSQSFLHKYF